MKVSRVACVWRRSLLTSLFTQLHFAFPMQRVRASPYPFWSLGDLVEGASSRVRWTAHTRPVVMRQRGSRACMTFAPFGGDQAVGFLQAHVLTYAVQAFLNDDWGVIG